MNIFKMEFDADLKLIWARSDEIKIISQELWKNLSFLWIFAKDFEQLNLRIWIWFKFKFEFKNLNSKKFIFRNFFMKFIFAEYKEKNY